MKSRNKLKKSLSPLGILSLALGSIIGWGTFVMPGDLFLESAGPLGTAIGISLGALAMIIISHSYGYMVKKYPVAGGEFAYAFKGFGRTHAFIAAWFLGLSYLSIVPLNATALGLIGRFIFPGILQQGYLYTIAGWDVYLGEIILASLVLIFLAWISAQGVSISGKIQTIMTFSLVGAILLLLGVSLFHTKTNFSNLQPAFPQDVTPIKSALSILAIAPWLYVGFDTIPQAAEEFDFSAGKAYLLMSGSILFGAFIYIAMNTITAIVFPWEELMAQAPQWATGLAVEELMGNIGLFILAVALLSSILAGITGFYMASSRLLLSMARAKALPAWFGKIDPIHNTPINAILFVLMISLLAPWFGRQVLTWVVDMASVGAAIGYFYTSATAFRLARQEENKGLQKVTSALGVLLSIAFIGLLVIPGMPGYLSYPSRVA
ncbi:MAG: APC family permease, partial [Staphylococcus equorum]|nr:APC family permease [Staphylococcus equorum]